MSEVDSDFHFFLQSLFNDINIFPSKSQVFEMVRCARESTVINVDAVDHATTSSDFLTFGEFCVFATELTRHYSAAFGPATAGSCLSSGCAKTGNATSCGSERGKAKKVELIRSGKSSAYDVFLGGSCNPTTWRQDTAIPYFKSQDITYYNPQQSNWVPEMIELEHQAKQTSQILFFVLNEMTRNVVSMIEVSYMAGHRRRLIVMIHPYPGSGHKINGERLSDEELSELDNAMSTVHDLVERQGAPVFSSIQAAMSCAAKVIKEKVAIEDLGLKDNAQPVKLAHIQIGDVLVRLREAFDTLDTARYGKISMADMKMAFRIHTHKDLPQRDLRLVTEVLQQLDGDSTKISNDQLLISFEEFCKIVSEFQQSPQQQQQQQLNGVPPDRAKLWDSFAMKTSHFLRCITHPFSSRHRRHVLQQQQQPQQRPANRENSLTRTLRDRRGSSVRDVYLGGSMDALNKWRDDIAIPVLKKNGLTFFNPQSSYETMALYSRR